MTIKKFKEIIANLPDHMDMCIDVAVIDPDSEFEIESVQRAEVRNIRFHEGNEPGTEPEAFVDCLVLTVEV